MKRFFNIKVFFILVLLSLLHITFAQSTKRTREIIAAEQIDNILLTIENGLFEVYDVVDIDSLKGDMRYYLEPIEDPYGTLSNCFVFTTALREEALQTLPERFNENFDENFVGDRIGVYDFGSGNILWMSEPIIAMPMGQLFTTRDINNDGEVDILTVWGDKSQEMWIYSWNGSSGRRINNIKGNYFSVIEGERNAFILFDAEGDGILEIKNLQDMAIEPTWSWNGELYGDWLSTPKLPETTLWPRNNIQVEVKCKVLKVNDSLYFNYTIENGISSKQRINNILINVRTNNYKSDEPDGWEKDYYFPLNLKGWRTLVLDHKGLIWPGNTGEGFTFISDKLVGISKFFIQGENQLPYVDTLDNIAFIDYIREDIVNNSVKGLTISPSDPTDTLISLTFIDSLLSYTDQSFALGWITNKPTEDKYDSLFNLAKTQLQQNDNNAAKTTLQTVLQQVDIDSTNNLTSEAYALIRYNTEYLVLKIPEQSLFNVAAINPAMSLVNPGSFTMELKGTGFTTNSVVYFNGNARTTTFVADTLLTAEIQSTDVSVAGNYPVWVSDGTTNSDTLTFSVVSTLPKPVRPVLECVRNNGDGTYTAFFGYKNENDVSVYIPVGNKNKFTPTPQDRGQTRVFLPGRKYKVFTVNFNGSNLVWTLNGRTSTASANSASCN